MNLARPLLLAASLLPACGGAASPTSADKPVADKPAADKPAAAKSTDPTPAERPEPVDRSQLPLHTVKDSVGDIAFSIDLPQADLKRDTRDNYVNWTFTDDPFTSPSITVKLATAPRDLDAMERSVKTGMDNPPLTVFTRKELDGGGMLVGAARGDGQYLALHAIARSGDRVLRCSVLHRTGTGGARDRPIPNFEAAKAWAETICASLRLD